METKSAQRESSGVVRALISCCCSCSLCRVLQCLCAASEETCALKRAGQVWEWSRGSTGLPWQWTGQTTHVQQKKYVPGSCGCAWKGNGRELRASQCCAAASEETYALKKSRKEWSRGSTGLSRQWLPLSLVWHAPSSIQGAETVKKITSWMTSKFKQNWHQN